MSDVRGCAIVKSRNDVSQPFMKDHEACNDTLWINGSDFEHFILMFRYLLMTCRVLSGSMSTFDQTELGLLYFQSLTATLKVRKFYFAYANASIRRISEIPLMLSVGKKTSLEYTGCIMCDLVRLERIRSQEN